MKLLQTILSHGLAALYSEALAMSRQVAFPGWPNSTRFNSVGGRMDLRLLNQTFIGYALEG